MNISVMYALLCAGCNMGNDLVFRSAGHKSEKGIYIFYFLSAVSGALVALALTKINGGIVFSVKDVFYGIIAGILAFAAYLMFLISLSGPDTSIYVTVYRLNIVPAVIIAFVIFQEKADIQRLIAIVLCIAGVMVFFIEKRSKKSANHRYLIISAGGCILAAMLNVFNKMAVLAGCFPFALLFWRFSTVALVSGIIVIISTENNLSIKNLHKPALSGLFVCFAVFTMMEAMNEGDVSLVLPVSQLSFVPLAVISWIFISDIVKTRKVVGITLAALSVVLIN